MASDSQVPGDAAGSGASTDSSPGSLQFNTGGQIARRRGSGAVRPGAGDLAAEMGGLYCAECGLKARSAGACQGYGAGCHPAMHTTSKKKTGLPAWARRPACAAAGRPAWVGQIPAGKAGRRGVAARQPEGLPAAPALTARITTVPSAAGRRGLARSAPGVPHFFLPNESFSVVTRLNTGLSAVWS